MKQQKTIQRENLIVSGMKINKCTSVWKESEEDKRQRIELLLFPKQQQQKKGVLQQEMEAEVQVERGMRFQEEVDEDTGVVCSGDNEDGDHVNEEKRRRRQENEGDNKNNKNKQ